MVKQPKRASELIGAGRGSGRITRAMQALPPGGIYIVANAADIKRCKQQARDLLSREDIRFMTLDDAMRGHALKGIEAAVRIDHCALDSAADYCIRAKKHELYWSLMNEMESMNHRWSLTQRKRSKR